jgi:ubiquinone/menaquinone biosynthesis C-methylase UbiE
LGETVLSIENSVEAFYESRREDERLQSREGQVEWFVTCSYIDRYLFPGARILEIGAGTGRYALRYAQMGYQVDAIEPVLANLDVLSARIKAGDNIRAIQGNALDLSRYEDNSFYRVLLLGPMYHLFSPVDKTRCLSEAHRVCKPGGLVYVAYCQFDPSMIQYAFMRGAYPTLIENGFLNEKTFQPISDPRTIFELHRKRDIDALSDGLPSRRLHYVGTDMFAHYMADSLKEMDEPLFQHYLEYTLNICENTDLTGVSNHVLDIREKLKES